MEEAATLTITQPHTDPRESGPVVCRYCSRKFVSLASLRPHLRACPSRWFDREVVLDGRHFRFKCNHRSGEEKALRQFAQEIVKSVKTPEERHRSLSSGLVLMQIRGIIKDLEVEMVGQGKPVADRVPAPIPVRARARAPVAASGAFPDEAELVEAERDFPSLVKALREGRITPSEFRERLATARRRL